MNFKKFIIMAFLTSILCFPVYADIVIHSNLKSVTGDGCVDFSGFWKGDGLVSDYCQYSGSAQVTPTGEPNSYTIGVDLHSMTLFCPADTKTELVATCNNGEIRILSKNADLDGKFEFDGKKETVKIKGTIILDSGVRLTLNYLNLSR